MEWVPVYVTDIEALKALLTIGLIAAVLLLRLTWGIGASPNPSRAIATCKLHQRPEDQCRDMHDE